MSAIIPDTKAPRASIITNLIAGGGAGMMEALACYPLDTVKVRMQLLRSSGLSGRNRPGFVKVVRSILQTESFGALYKGVSVVLLGMIPKMAIRFSSFEYYKEGLADATTLPAAQIVFWAGLTAGVTEALTVVTTMEVIKVRLQAQNTTNVTPRYRNAATAFVSIVRDEGFPTLYRGAGLTALRQGSNQAVCFSVYTYLDHAVRNLQSIEADGSVPFWQTTLIGLTAGTLGPLSNAPVDTLKTRLQTARRTKGAEKTATMIARDIYRQEGIWAFYKGLTPRLMRVAPGQAVTFTVYEYIKGKINRSKSLARRFPDAEFDKL